MSSMIDLLLGKGEALKEQPKITMEIPRLGSGEAKFELEFRGLTSSEIESLPESDHAADRGVHWILKSVQNIDFADERLIALLMPSGRKTPLTPAEVVKKLFLPGEIAQLYNKIAEISGFGESAVRAVEKN